jgi:hypothetical protein
MNKDYLDKYNKLIKKLEQCPNVTCGVNGNKHIDKERYHYDQDVIYRKFIKDIATGKINNAEEILNLAKLLNNKVVKKDTGLWYA